MEWIVIAGGLTLALWFTAEGWRKSRVANRTLRQVNKEMHGALLSCRDSMVEQERTNVQLVQKLREYEERERSRVRASR